MQLVTQLPGPGDAPADSTVLLRADRITAAKRRWRATADDGREFGFDLEAPLAHGVVFHREGATAYRFEQLPEPVFRIGYGDAAEAARLAWLVGNLHFPAAFADDGMLVADDPAVAQLLEREGIPCDRAERIFCPPPRSGGGHRHHSHGHSHSH